MQGSQAELLPYAVLYVPTAQALQTADPADFKVPGGHAVHSAPSAPVYPGTHVQLSSVGLNASDCV